MNDERGDLTLSTIAMPGDANVNGDIFGGWVMSQMDLAGSVPAKKATCNRIATVAVDKMKFLKPVKVGDRVNCYTEIIHTGNTSISVKVNVYADRMTQHFEEKVTEATFIYVSIDDNGRPQSISLTSKE